MKNTDPLTQILEANNTLIDTNKKLSQTNKHRFERIKELNKNQKKMSVCFNKLYKFINSKNNKTWEETELTNELFEIITLNEKK
jgi:hypothetical protein